MNNVRFRCWFMVIFRWCHILRYNYYIKYDSHSFSLVCNDVRSFCDACDKMAWASCNKTGHILCWYDIGRNRIFIVYLYVGRAWKFCIFCDRDACDVLPGKNSNKLQIILQLFIQIQIYINKNECRGSHSHQFEIDLCFSYTIYVLMLSIDYYNCFLYTLGMNLWVFSLFLIVMIDDRVG